MVIKEITQTNTETPLFTKEFASEFGSLVFNPQIHTLFDQQTHNYYISRDETAIRYEIEDNEGNLVFAYKIRDRRFDGTKSWKPTPLTNWSYQGPENKITAPAIETSKYWGDPRFTLTRDYTSEIARFIRNPFTKLPYKNPDQTKLLNWLSLWKQVVAGLNTPYPGWISQQQIKGYNDYIFEITKASFMAQGYEFLSAIPTWFHVAKRNEGFGFQYANPNDQEVINNLDEKLPFPNEIKSWAVVLQFWAELAEIAGITPERHINPNLITRTNGKIVTYPLRPNYNLWQIYPLTQ